MPLYVNIVCDDEECRHLQPAWFDTFDENLGDLVEGLKGIGCCVEGDDPLHLQFYCPNHDT